LSFIRATNQEFAERLYADLQSKEKRDFSLRRPTRLQEQTWKKRRRPAPFEMTVWVGGRGEGDVD
jgi:hypothetical protein